MSDPNPAISPFQTVTSKKSGKINKSTIVITICIVVFLILGVVAGVLLVRQQQNISERAQQALCPAAEKCPVPNQKDMLLSCTIPNEDGSPRELSCSNPDNVGQIAECGGVSFCCPPPVTSDWTQELTLCASPTPTPILTPTPTPTPDPFATVAPTPTSTATSTATATATATATSTTYSTSTATPLVQATPREIPVSGTDWPTILGVGLGAAAIIGAILLAI